MSSSSARPIRSRRLARGRERTPPPVDHRSSMEPVNGTTAEQMKAFCDDKGPFALFITDSAPPTEPAGIVRWLRKMRPADKERGVFTLEQLYSVLGCRAIETMPGALGTPSDKEDFIAIFDEEGSHRPLNQLLVHTQFGPSKLRGPVIWAPSSMLD